MVVKKSKVMHCCTAIVLCLVCHSLLAAYGAMTKPEYFANDWMVAMGYGQTTDSKQTRVVTAVSASGQPEAGYNFKLSKMDLFALELANTSGFTTLFLSTIKDSTLQQQAIGAQQYSAAASYRMQALLLGYHQIFQGLMVRAALGVADQKLIPVRPGSFPVTVSQYGNKAANVEGKYLWHFSDKVALQLAAGYLYLQKNQKLVGSGPTAVTWHYNPSSAYVLVGLSSEF